MTTFKSIFGEVMTWLSHIRLAVLLVLFLPLGVSAQTFSGATLNNSTLSSPHVTGTAGLAGATLTGGNFSGPNLNQATLTNAFLDSSNVNFSGPTAITVGTCQTSGTVGSTCTRVISWQSNRSFPDANYAASCTGVNPIGGAVVVSITAKAASTITVQLTQVTGTAASSYGEIDCVSAGS